MTFTEASTEAIDYAGLADQFNESHGLSWDADLVARYLQDYDDSLGDTIQDHLECYADHDQLLTISNGEAPVNG